MTKEDAKLRLDSTEWLIKELTSLVAQYNACKTANERRLLLPKIKQLSDKGIFEIREILK